MCCQKNCWKCSAHLSHVSLLGERISRERKSGDLVLVLALLLAGWVGGHLLQHGEPEQKGKIGGQGGRKGRRERN